MANDNETSESGSPIYRHSPKESSWQAAEHSNRNIESIEQHIEKYVGPIETVYHEIISDQIHLDVLIVPATDAKPYHMLVTSGVSDLPMTLPEGIDHPDRVELLVALPPTWPLDQAKFEDENVYWPIRWLKNIGRLPHDYGTWVGWGHTIPNGDPPEKIANTDFVGMMLAPSYWLNKEFHHLHAESGDTVMFYNLVPLFKEEMELKLKQGAEELDNRFEQNNIGFEINPGRPNVAKNKKEFFSRFR